MGHLGHFELKNSHRNAAGEICLVTPLSQIQDVPEEDFYRYDSRAVRLPLLEYVNGLPMRTPPAGLIGFAPSFCKRNSKRVPAFGGLSVGVSNSSSFSTLRTAPLPDLSWELRQRSRCLLCAGGRTSGRDLTVEGEHVLETPPQWPRHAATLSSLRCRRRARILSGEPAVFTAATISRIRARELGRHEDRNDKNLIIGPHAAKRGITGQFGDSWHGKQNEIIPRKLTHYRNLQTPRGEFH